MKKHAIIPIFIPHKGCPNECIFCNQKKITAHQKSVTVKDVEDIVETWLPTLQNRGIETIELSFFGGSFTGIPMDEQKAYLAVAKKYKGMGKIDKIHMSTRPDYINEEILDNLVSYGADTIELGVQSFDDEVLRKAKRGHDSSIVYKSSKMIQDYGFELGIQLMIGLPGDSRESCTYSAEETVKIGPSIARLYPTVTIKDTELYDCWRNGTFIPLTQDEAVYRTKEMYKILDAAGIDIIRVGLKSSDIINEDGDIAPGTFHPAFRQLVEGQIARDEIENQLKNSGILPSHDTCAPEKRIKADFLSCRDSYPELIGHKAVNREYFTDNYPTLNIKFKVDDSLKNKQYKVLLKRRTKDEHTVKSGSYSNR